MVSAVDGTEHIMYSIQSMVSAVDGTEHIMYSIKSIYASVYKEEI